MHDWEKSDSAIVAVKPPNKAGVPVAEAVEPRAGTKGNADQQSTYRTQSRKRVIQALSRVRQTTASPSNTQGRSRMLELGSSGSVRGVSSNGHPYRDQLNLRELKEIVGLVVGSDADSSKRTALVIPPVHLTMALSEVHQSLRELEKDSEELITTSSIPDL